MISEAGYTSRTSQEGGGEIGDEQGEWVISREWSTMIVGTIRLQSE